MEFMLSAQTKGGGDYHLCSLFLDLCHRLVLGRVIVKGAPPPHSFVPKTPTKDLALFSTFVIQNSKLSVHCHIIFNNRLLLTTTLNAIHCIYYILLVSQNIVPTETIIYFY